MVTNPVCILLMFSLSCKPFLINPLTAAGLTSSQTPSVGRWSLVVTLNMMMFCLNSQPFPAEPLSCCIVEDAAVQDPGPVVAAVLHFPPHLAVYSPQHTVAVLGQQPLNPAEEAGPCHHPPAQAVEVLHPLTKCEEMTLRSFH